MTHFICSVRKKTKRVKAGQLVTLGSWWACENTRVDYPLEKPSKLRSSANTKITGHISAMKPTHLLLGGQGLGLDAEYSAFLMGMKTCFKDSQTCYSD